MKKHLPLIILITSLLIFVFSFIAIIFSYELAANINVIGIRIAALIIAFASFGSSSFFSYLIYTHNRTVSSINDDTNKRAELFRELQFASGNYSIIEFMDRMLIYEESSRYIDNFLTKNNYDFHMLEAKVNLDNILKNPEDFHFTSIRIPFKVIEGKIVSKIEFQKLIFDRNGERFEFNPVYDGFAQTFILYNERTKRNNAIVNLITKKSDYFFVASQVNLFSKIKVNLQIVSLLSVKVKGVIELYFTNPEQIEGDGTNTYKINTSNFTLTKMPQVDNFHIS